MSTGSIQGFDISATVEQIEEPADFDFDWQFISVGQQKAQCWRLIIDKINFQANLRIDLHVFGFKSFPRLARTGRIKLCIQIRLMQKSHDDICRQYSRAPMMKRQPFQRKSRRNPVGGRV